MWLPNMKGQSIAKAVQAFKEAGVEAVVWDRAGGHRSGAVREVGVVLVEQPAASPELNPAERMFEELRRKVEGSTYSDIDQKQVALAADPAKVRSIAGWSWIGEARRSLPLNAAPL